MRMAKVAILCDQKTAKRKWSYGLNIFENYIGEILTNEGLPYVSIDEVDSLSADYADVLIVALADDTKATAEKIYQFAEQGGTVITYAGLPKLAAMLNCRQLPVQSVGYTRVPASLGETRPLRSLHVAPWELLSEENAATVQQIGTVHYDHPESDQSYHALQKFQVGAGTIERWSVNIPNTIVTMQQGTRPVLEDGIPAIDGSAKLDEDILKADDAVALDWDLDRSRTETGQPYFAHPYADFWREISVSHLLQTVTSRGLTLPFVGRWPEGVERVATISHDSDGNQDVHAISTLDILQECDIHSTWCMLEPGYSGEVYEKIVAAGHELAFHYNAVVHEKKVWSKESFDRQHEWLKEATGLPHAISNKNHYTRFEGWGELFEWCEDNGIQSDQTRGPSKMGNVGFIFGTCQPYYPIAWANDENRLYDVIEISFLTQDMDLKAWADSSVIRPFLEQVSLVNGGVAHFLFHQTHIHNKEEVRHAFRTLSNKAREMGYIFWTGQQINDWVRARRKAEIQGVDSNGQVKVQGDIPQGLVVYVPVKEGETADIHQYGVPCKKVVY